MEPVEQLLSNAVDNLDAVIAAEGVRPRVEYLARIARELAMQAVDLVRRDAAESGDEAA